MKIRLMDVGDVGEVAKVHVESLPGEFLPSLGRKFLEVFYEAAVGDPGFLGFLAEDRGRIAGFVVGVLNMKGFFRRVLVKNLWKFGWSVLGKLIGNPRVFFSMIETVVYPVKESGPEAELVVIAVNEGSRGRGVGRSLVKRLEKAFREKGISEYKVTVTQKNARARVFYEGLGFCTAGSFGFYGKRWNLMRKKI